MCVTSGNSGSYSNLDVSNLLLDVTTSAQAPQACDTYLYVLPKELLRVLMTIQMDIESRHFRPIMLKVPA